MYPSQQLVLDELFGRLSADGRGEALFGTTDLSSYREAIMACCLGEALPEYYFEFPLAGQPWLDMLQLYDRQTLLNRGSFDGNDAYGYKKVFERFVRDADAFKSKRGKSLCMGTELDLSRDAGKSVGFYISGARSERLVREAMAMLGEGEARIGVALDVIRRAPDFWEPYYIGAMPGREGAPFRLGFTVMQGKLARYAGNASLFADHLEAMGLTATSGEMLELTGKTAALDLNWDIQLDVLDDGSIGTVLGLSWALESVRIRDARQSFADGSMRRLMELLEQAGLADRRWRLIPGAFFVDKMLYLEDGEMRTLGLIGRSNFAKVKWKAGVPQTAKFYMAAKGYEVD